MKTVFVSWSKELGFHRDPDGWYVQRQDYEDLARVAVFALEALTTRPDNLQRATEQLEHALRHQPRAGARA